MKNFTPRRQLLKLLLLNFLAKFPPKRKRFNEQFNLCEAKISLDDIIKPINSRTNNKSPGYVGLTAEFYKHFLNELASVLLDIYDSWRNLDTVSLTSRTGIISVL